MIDRCRDCNAEISRGSERCRRCNVAFMAYRAAVDLDEKDQELIRLIDVAGLTPARVARREGVSRAAIERKLAKARKRQVLLE